MKHLRPLQPLWGVTQEQFDKFPIEQEILSRDFQHGRLCGRPFIIVDRPPHEATG